MEVGNLLTSVLLLCFVLFVLQFIFVQIDQSIDATYTNLSKANITIASNTTFETMQKFNKSAAGLKNSLDKLGSDNFIDKILGMGGVFYFLTIDTASTIISLVLSIPTIIMNILFFPGSPLNYVIPSSIRMLFVSLLLTILIIKLVLWFINRR